MKIPETKPIIYKRGKGTSVQEKTLEQQFEEEIARRGGRKDILVSGKDLSFKIQEGKPFLRDLGTGKELKMIDTSITHLAKKVGYPEYLIEALEDDVVERSLNTRIKQKLKSDYRLRYEDDTVKAIMAPSTGIYDVNDILKDFIQKVDTSGYYVGDCQTNGYYWTLKLFKDTPAHERYLGVETKQGFSIRTSEFGFGAFAASIMAYKLVCLNGMFSWRDKDGFRIVHHDIPEVINPVVRFHDLLNTAPEAYEVLGDAVDEARNVTIRYPEMFIRLLGINYKLWSADVQNSKLMKSFMDDYYKGPEIDGTLYDIYDALTQWAHEGFNSWQTNNQKVDKMSADILVDYQRHNDKAIELTESKELQLV
jgi:hypothetical protein